MKNLLVLLILAIPLFAQDYDRNILIEVFTNSHCPLCPAAHSTIDSYLATSPNKDRVNYIYYHMPFPYSDDQLNQANKEDASGRNNYYGPFSSTPKAFFDGAVQAANYSQWASIINNRLSVKSPVNIALTGRREDNVVTISSEVTFPGGTIFGSTVIHFVVVEDVEYAGRNGISNHKNVMREMITSPSGEIIQPSGKQSVDKTFALSSTWDESKVSFLVFVQSAATKEIYQSQLIDFTSLTITGITDNQSVPQQFELNQNYPNPFNPATVIEYTIRGAQTGSSESKLVTLKVYDVLGTEISSLVNKNQSPGKYNVVFNAADLPGGIYFYRLNYDGRSITKKMTLLK